LTNFLVPVAEAARLLSASEGTVASWLDQGLLREWARGPKRRIVDVKEALLLCGLRHDLQHISPTVVRTLGLDLDGIADPDVAARLAAAFAGPAGLNRDKLEAAVGRYLALGYTPAQIAASLDRVAAYRARSQRHDGRGAAVAPARNSAAS
jgi:hypothetical protein